MRSRFRSGLRAGRFGTGIVSGKGDRVSGVDWHCRGVAEREEGDRRRMLFRNEL